MNRYWKTIVTLAMVLGLLLSLSVSAGAQELNSANVNRFNVVLVVDGSGSLRSGARPTDPKGLRYDAMKLFLGLLTENGNNVGAVVFNDGILLDTGLKPMKNMAAKLDLVQQIEAAGARDDTNIGSAILRATEILKGMSAQNGLPSAILLLSDGRTDLRQRSDVERAAQDGNRAVENALAENIAIHGILLNTNDGGAAGEILYYTQSTGGTYEEVSDPDDLATAFQRFYTIINNTEYSGATKTQFGPDGKAEVSFVVPRFGVEEVNIVVELKDALTRVEIIKPDNTSLTGAQISSMSIYTTRYQLTKLPAPMAGRWTVRLTGVPNDTVDINMLYNSSMSVTLSSDCDGNYLVNKPYHFLCQVKDSSMPELSDVDLNSMTATLHVTNAVTQEIQEYPMSVSGGYHAEVRFPQEGSYYVYASVGCDGFLVNTETMMIDAGNLPPECGQSIYETVKTGLFHDGLWSGDVTGYFRDPEEAELSYSLSTDGYGDAVRLENGTLTVDCNDQGKIQLQVVATDPFGASAELPVTLIEDNVTRQYVAAGAGTIAAAGALIGLLFFLKSRRRCSLEISVIAFDNGEMSDLIPLYNFRGKRSLKTMGNIYRARAEDFWFEATTDKNTCLFKGKKPFFCNGSQTKSTQILAGVTTKVFFDADASCGLEITAYNNNY